MKPRQRGRAENANPYESPKPATPEARSSHHWLHPADPGAAAATWFVAVFCVHVTLLAALARYAGGGTLTWSPLVWLALAAGLFFRLGPVRRVVLLLGSMLVVGGLVGCIGVLFGWVDAEEIRIGTAVIENPPTWMQVAILAAFVISFLYPVLVLWSPDVRKRFRDRLP